MRGRRREVRAILQYRSHKTRTHWLSRNAIVLWFLLDSRAGASLPLPNSLPLRRASSITIVCGASCNFQGNRFKTTRNRMKQSKDPFEAAFEEQEDSPPESPVEAFEEQNPSAVGAQGTSAGQEDDISNSSGTKTAIQFTPATKFHSAGPSGRPMTNVTKNKDDEDEEEEENMDVELGKFPSSADPDKMAKMQVILSRFTEEQMSRYESFRRAGFQKANMKRLLASITGTQKISVPMTIVVSGIAKMFVGDVVETARIVMKERKESGPIRPCHLREAYRRLKVEGKVCKRTASRLFR
ncbi:transcription initiation factor TFIID subunit 11 isoform X2 [Prosopis cineraria]|uniref:transcription initiation factor TFIID subunit 11 isoform X2 n=1 Tax=Prosopis cineraria TaxID=364024 RepID=UPI00240EB463|nr:transcription initiation factor TFIID subunit 11 isoform X2 [Prosopis cineraria]